MPSRIQWFPTGDGFFGAVLPALRAAARSIRIETYIFSSLSPGTEILDELVAAARRGVHVQVMVDFLGSYGLADEFWNPLRSAGGDFRWFNPRRFSPIRNHRKSIICDDQIAFVGGCNLAPEYTGDGITSGFREISVQIEGPMATALASSFDALFKRTAIGNRRWRLLSRLDQPPLIAAQPQGAVLSGGPGLRRSSLVVELHRDLARTGNLDILTPYFLPPIRVRLAIQKVARRGGRVRLVLPGKSDVTLSQLAAQSLYRRLFRAGIEVYEYQPQILHAKLLCFDHTAYVGSCNLDIRSLRINHELMARLDGPTAVNESRKLFESVLQESQRITPQELSIRRTVFTRVKESWSHFLLATVDPYITYWLTKK